MQMLHDQGVTVQSGLCAGDLCAGGVCSILQVIVGSRLVRLSLLPVVIGIDSHGTKLIVISFHTTCIANSVLI